MTDPARGRGPWDIPEITLAQFLQARLDEDQALAEGPMILDFPSYRSGLISEDLSFMAGPGHPARALADIEAKRAILRRVEETAPPYADARQQEVHETLVNEVLPQLGVPFAEHPEYRADEWAPAR